MYAAASTHTAKSGSFCLLITFEIIFMLFEYRTTFNALKTLNVLISLKSFSILYPDAIMPKDDTIASISIIAIGVNGYFMKAVAAPPERSFAL
jgi:hypothetical protein